LTFSDAFVLSLQVALLVFGLLLLFGLLSLRWRRHTGLPWRERLRMLAHYVGVRAVGAFFAGVTVLIVVLAALTVNLHRPPADTTPSVRTSGVTGPVSVDLRLDDCGDPVRGVVTAPGARPGRGRGARQAEQFVRLYSDADGFQRVEFDRRGRAVFTFSEPTAKRGLLSCFFQLPTVSGNRGGSTVKLAMSDYLQVDTTESSPAPTGYFSGSSIWRCPAGQTCPSLATIEYAIESGTKQLILLILAAVLGSLTAIFVSETMIAGIRRRLEARSDG